MLHWIAIQYIVNAYGNSSFKGRGYEKFTLIILDKYLAWVIWNPWYCLKIFGIH